MCQSCLERTELSSLVETRIKRSQETRDPSLDHADAQQLKSLKSMFCFCDYTRDLLQKVCDGWRPRRKQFLSHIPTRSAKREATRKARL